MTWLGMWWASTWALLVESAPWLLAGFGLAGFVHVLVPVERLTRHLGRPGLSSVLKAAVIGIPLPLCSCSVIPVASSLRRQGAGKGAFLSFIISTPETGADSIALSYALLGPVLAVVRPIAAAITAVAAGLVVDTWDNPGAGPRTDDVASKPSHAEPQAGGCQDGACACDGPSSAPGARWQTALRFGYVDMIADLAPWLIVGFALAGLASALMPSGFLERHIGTGVAAMLLMLVVGLPLYICATSSTPIAAALIAKGLSPGAALVLLLVGPATNVATMLIVARDVGRWGVAIYLVVIAIVAIAAGLLVDAIGVSASSVGSDGAGDTHVASNLAQSAVALIMLLLIANGLRLRMRSSPS